MARLMLSAGMFSALAATMAPRKRGLESGSPPPFFAAMLISLMRRVNILPRLASSAPFLCLMVAHFEWPDMARPLFGTFVGSRDSPAERSQTASQVCRRKWIIARYDSPVASLLRKTIARTTTGRNGPEHPCPHEQARWPYSVVDCDGHAP